MTLGDFLENFATVYLSFLHNLKLDFERNESSLQQFIANVWELDFLEITLFQYFIILMLLLTGVSNFLRDVEIRGYSSVFWRSIIIILDLSTTIFAVYFSWICLRFFIGMFL
jgi:hypothetical protein